MLNVDVVPEFVKETLDPLFTVALLENTVTEAPVIDPESPDIVVIPDPPLPPDPPKEE